MTVAEIISFAASQAYLDTPDILTPALDVLARAPGVINLWTGVRVEDNKTAYIFVQWESNDHIQSWQSSPNHAHFASLSQPCSDSPSSHPSPTARRLIPFVSPEAALTAPLTEICILRPKIDSEANRMLDLVHVLNAKLSRDTVRGCYGPRVAEVEDPGAGTGSVGWLIGWDDLQAHVDAVKGDADAIALVGSAEIEIAHIPLKKYVCVGGGT